MGEAVLRVKEVVAGDWQGRIRISGEVMEELALKEGDVVEVEGRRLTAALASRGPPVDVGERVARLDEWTARNAGVAVGDTVKVRRARTVLVATAVVLEAQMPLAVDETLAEYVKHRLIGRPVVAGDIVPVSVLGSTVPFTALSTEPPGVVVVVETTRLTVTVKHLLGISALAAKEHAKVGERVPVIGIAAPPRRGLKVKVSYRKPSGAWIGRELETAEDGIFTDSFVADEPGVWVVKAEGGRTTLFAFVFVEG